MTQRDSSYQNSTRLWFL